MKESLEYWEKRAETYRFLDDVKSKRTAYKIVETAKKLGLPEDSLILDVGCAEGTISKVLKENLRHSRVLGIDFSPFMISSAMKKRIPGLSFHCCDFFNFYSEKKFDLILFSLVLHHLLEGKDSKAVFKASSLLKETGKIIVAEAVPPEDEIFDYYQEIFKIKENRNCYLLNDLISILRANGFISVRSFSFRFEIRLLSWLRDNTLSEEKRALIYRMHTEASSEFKAAYRMSYIGDGDYSLSCKMVILSGKKSF